MSESCIEIARPEHLTTQVPRNDDLLAELEMLAKGRYTQEDDEYMKEYNRESPPPPLVAPEARRHRFNRGRGDWHGGSRGRDFYQNNRDRDNRGGFHRDNREGYERNAPRNNRGGGYQRDGRDSSYRDSREGYSRDGRDGFTQRDNRDGFHQRDNRDGFHQRDNRDGFQTRDNRDGFQPRDNRDGFQPRENRDGFQPRDNRDGYHQRDNRDSPHQRNDRDGSFQRDNRVGFSQRSHEASNAGAQQSSSAGFYGGTRDATQGVRNEHLHSRDDQYGSAHTSQRDLR